MDRDYDIFEVLPDGSPLWRDVISGHENAIRRLNELAALTPNELHLMHVPTKTLIAAINTPKH